MENAKDISEISMTLIAYSGDARTHAFQALDFAKKGEYASAAEYISEAKRCFSKAHQAQTDLLVDEANGHDIQVNVLLIHAQDHLMTSMLAMELIEEIIELHEDKEDRKEKKP